MAGYQTQFGEQKPVAGMPNSDERLWATLAHVAILVFAVFGPLIIWLVKKQESQFVEDQAKEALNFQLAVLIAQLVLVPTCIGPLVVVIVGIVYAVIAAMEANKGVYYRYPYTIRMIN